MYSNQLFLFVRLLTWIWSSFERVTSFSAVLPYGKIDFSGAATLDFESNLHYWIQKRIYMERIKEQGIIELLLGISSGIYRDVQAFEIWWFASIFFLQCVIAKMKSAATLIVLQEVACVIKCNNDLRTHKKGRAVHCYVRCWKYADGHINWALKHGLLWYL